MIADGESPNNVLCLTFTRRASKEMKERILAELGPLHGPEVEIGTIHSVALKILRRFGDRLGYRPDRPGQRITVCGEDEQQEFLEAARGLSLSKKVLVRDIDACFWHYNSRGECDEQCEASGAVARLWNTYRRLLIENNSVDFGGILAGVIRLFEEFDDVRREYHVRWKHVLLDEAHDSNPAQWKFLKAIDPENLFVVLDFRQGIYQFNGAAPNVTREMIGR